MPSKKFKTLALQDTTPEPTKYMGEDIEKISISSKMNAGVEPAII